MKTYEQIAGIIKKRASKKLARNTYLIRKEDGEFAVRYHDTEIIVWHKDHTATLNTGGWYTVTTKERINRWGPVNVYAVKGVWMVNQRIFHDGMTFTEEGVEVTDRLFKEETNEEAKYLHKERQLRKMISRYVKGFCEDIKTKGLGFPEPGDCLMCRLGADGGVEHLLSHLQEHYYVRSLLWLAFKEKGYRDVWLVWDLTDRHDTHMAGLALRKYFRARKTQMLEMMMKGESNDGQFQRGRDDLSASARAAGVSA